MILVGFMRGKSIFQHGNLDLYSRIGALVWLMVFLLLVSTTIYLFLREWAAHYNQLEQTSVLFYGGLIRLCITIIVHRKLSFLIFLFITVFTSI